ASTGTNLTFAWTQLTGKTVTLSSATTTNPTFTAPSVVSSNEAALSFNLTVADQFGRQSNDTTAVTITAPAAPVANAGTDQSVVPGGIVTLTGDASTGT